MTIWRDRSVAGGILLPRGVVVRDRDPSKDIGTLRFWQVFVKPSTASHCGKRCRSGRNSGTMPAGDDSPRNETAYVGSASMGGTASKHPAPRPSVRGAPSARVERGGNAEVSYA